MGGKRLISPYRCLHWVRGPTQWEIPPRQWRILLGRIWPKVKEATCDHWQHSILFHRTGKVIKQEKTTERIKTSKGKAVTIVFSASCLTESYFSVLTTTPNNWRERLMGQVPTLGTLFRKKEMTINGEKKKQKGGSFPPNRQRRPGKAPRIISRTNVLW